MLQKNFQDILSERKSALLKKWFDIILDTYPADAAILFKKQNKPFTNPVGSTIYQGLEALLEEILKGNASETPSASLESIIKIRAVQEFTPSQALMFIFLLKKVIHEEMKSEMEDPLYVKEFLALEAIIDALALQSFDIYIKCREKIYELRVKELQSLTFRQLQRANRMYDSDKDKHENSCTYNNRDAVERKEAIK